MSTPPGNTNVLIDEPPPGSSPGDRSTLGFADFSEKGTPGIPLGPFYSLDEATTALGQRQVDSFWYDEADTFFREGGSRFYFSRVVGAGVATASVNILDAGGAVSLVATATSPGEWANALTLDFDVPGDAPGTYKVVVKLAGNVVDTSADLTTQADAIAWATNSDYIRLALGASANVPAVVAGRALVGGTDNRAAATDATFGEALDVFDPELGPMQVALPGKTTDAAHAFLLGHEASHAPNLRVALLDGADTPSKSALITEAAAQRGQDGARFSGLFAPWVEVPGIIPGTKRTVPPSAYVAGLIARNDGLGLSPNQPPAGAFGFAQYATGVSQSWSESDRGDLNDAGVNIIKVRNGRVNLMGFRSLADPVNDPNWKMLQWARMAMSLFYLGDQILDSHSFEQIDGQGHLYSQVAVEVTGMVREFYDGAFAGSLDGDTFADAAVIDTGPQVNTQAVRDAEKLACLIKAHFSGCAERTELQLAKRLNTEAL